MTWHCSDREMKTKHVGTGSMNGSAWKSGRVGNRNSRGHGGRIGVGDRHASLAAAAVPMLVGPRRCGLVAGPPFTIIGDESCVGC